MTQYETYTFILCLIVFVIFTSLFATLFTYLVKCFIRLIRCGAEDEALLKEFREQTNKKKKTTVLDILSAVFSIIVCIALFVSFSFSLYLNITEKDAANGLPSLKIVKSASMSYINEKNEHLQKNGIDNHLQTFDLIVTERMPNEFDLKLYDIVVYEKNGDLIIHRIVGIEEPNEKHPDKRFFVLQGDAVQYKDEFPVTYDQMRGIYHNVRVPFVGSFIIFMQSPAGWLCILLVLFAIILIPFVEKKIEKEKKARLQVLYHGKACLTLPQTYVERRMPVQPMILSHFHLCLRIQKTEPQIELLVHKATGGLKRQNEKGNKRK